MATDWVTTTEAAELSGYHLVTLRRLLLSGRVKGKKWGQQWQVSRKSLMAYLREQQAKGERRGAKPRVAGP